MHKKLLKWDRHKLTKNQNLNYLSIDNKLQKVVTFQTKIIFCHKKENKNQKLKLDC